MEKIMFILITLFLAQIVNAQSNPIDYLGQTPPTDTPVVFARGIVSTEYQEHGAPAFSPDGNEVFWWKNKRPKSENEKWINSSMTMRRFGNIWTSPEISRFAATPIFSHDGERLYFDLIKTADVHFRNNGPWYAEKHGTAWSELKCLGLVDSFPQLKFAFGISIARSGNLYFVGYAEGLRNNYGIFRTELVNGKYTKPELLPATVNAPGDILNWTPFIAQDESFLIFSSSRGTSVNDQGDLYITFRRPGGNWTDAVSLGATINTNQQERLPAVSPDGK